MRKPTYINPYKLFYGAFVPNWLLQRTEITSGAKLMYARLCQYAGDDGHCFPSQDQLSQALGIRERQVRNQLAELIGHKLIEKRRAGLRKTNRYYFLKHRWQQAAVPLPSRDERTTEIPKRQSSAALDRQSSAALDRQSSAALDRQYTVNGGASKPRGTKASGRVRESVVRDSSQETHSSSPTPPPTILSAPCLTTAAEDEEERRFQEFWQAYPRHFNLTAAHQAFKDAHVDDALLATILEALQVQPAAWKRQGLRLAPQPAVYLRDTMWLDVKPDAPSWLTDLDVDGHPVTPQCCEDRCADPIGSLSDRRCDPHALSRISEEATHLLAVLRKYTYVGADTDERDRLIAAVVESNHVNGSADRISRAVQRAWEDKGPDLTAESLAHDVIVPALRDYRAPQKLAVRN
jgi:hypothetical protein